MACYEKGENHGKAVVFLLSQACEIKYDVLTISSVPAPPPPKCGPVYPRPAICLLTSIPEPLTYTDGTEQPPLPQPH